MSDLLIALAYYSIPLMLFYFVRKRHDIPFSWIFLCFGTFITACGTTHILDVWTLWYPTYWLSGAAKAMTAVISLYTANRLVSLIPQALTLPSPAQLEEKNRLLAKEISDRLATEIKLKRALQQLQFHVENSPLGVIEWDNEFRVQRWSQQAEKIFGWTAEEMLGKHLMQWQFIHADDVDGVKRDMLHLINGSEPRLICSNRNYTKVGEVIHCEWYNSALFDELGNLVSILSLVLDVTQQEQATTALEQANLELEARVEHRTAQLKQANDHLSIEVQERKQAQEALDRERQQLRHIIANAPVPMAIFDTQMRYLAYSQAWLILQGCEGESIIGRSHYEVLSDIPEKWKHIHQRALAGEILTNPEDVWHRANGSTLYTRWAIQPWYEPDGEIGGIVLASIRINELVEAREAALQAARIKSEFLANMSHEIRTPMNGVLGMAGLLLQTPLTPQQLDYAQTIRSSASHLLMIINDILDFSKLEAGEMHLEKLDFDLDNCLDSVVDILAAPAEEKQLEFAILVNSNVPRQLQGDSGRLRQILLNLVANAIKFTDAGQVVVNVSISETGEAENTEISLATTGQRESVNSTSFCSPIWLRFEVKDTGIGISPENQQKLFQAFSQVDASTTRQYGGTGLGLVICKQLVELIGGEIGIDSLLGQGSTFWFTAVFGQQTIPTKPDILPLTQRKLLVVDQHAITRQAVRLLAQSWGMQVDEAEDKATALQALYSSAARGCLYDVVLLDWQLPPQQGAMLVPQIRSDPTLAPTKIIVMTTMQQREQVERLKSLDVSGYVLKPLRTARLLYCLLNSLTECASTTVADHTLQTINGREITPGRQTALGDQPLGSDLKILLVEDHPVNQAVILNQLQMLSLTADCVSNGAEALERLQANTYDVILMDCQMPILDGYQATQELRRREGAKQHTVVIALTAHALPTDREKCLAAGMDDYLSKPIEQDALGAAIQRWTKHKVLPNVTATPSTGVIPQLVPVEDTLLNWQRLKSISRGKVALQQKLLQSFAENAQPGLDQIRLALQDNDFTIIEQQAHRIKGSSANVGVLVMPEVAAQLERQAREKTLEGALERLEALESHLAHVKAFLERWHIE